MNQKLTLLLCLTPIFLEAQVKDENKAKEIAKQVIAPPLPAGSKKLDAMQKRSRDLMKKHTEYVKNVTSGKIDPFAHLRKARPKQERDLKTIENHIGNLSREKNEKKSKVPTLKTLKKLPSK